MAGRGGGSSCCRCWPELLTCCCWTSPVSDFIIVAYSHFLKGTVEITIEREKERGIWREREKERERERKKEGFGEIWREKEKERKCAH